MIRDPPLSLTRANSCEQAGQPLRDSVCVCVCVCEGGEEREGARKGGRQGERRRERGGEGERESQSTIERGALSLRRETRPSASLCWDTMNRWVRIVECGLSGDFWRVGSGRI